VAIKASITEEEFAALNDALKPEFIKQDDGAYRLDVEAVNGIGLENVSGLRSALEKERQAAKDATAQLKAFDGLDAKKAKSALKKVTEMADWDPQKEVAERIAERERQLVARHQEELEAATGKHKVLHGQLEKLLVTNAVTKALQDAGGNIGLLEPHVANRVRMRQSGDQLIAEVVDPTTGIARVGDGMGNPMTIPQLVEELRSDKTFAGAFAGTGSTGTGSLNGSTGVPRAPVQTQTGVLRINRSDQQAINDNWEKIADGSAEVVDG